MASLSNDRGLWRLLTVLPDGSRKALRLGRISKRDAEKFKDRVERIVGCIKLGEVLDADTASWASRLPDDEFSKLVAIGLLAPRAKPQAATLDSFISGYIESRKADAAPRSIELYERARLDLVAFFGAGKPLGAISPGDADDFRRHLRGRVSENTANRRVQFAKQFFRAACRRRLLGENPFADLTGGIKANAARFHFVSREVADQVSNACPSTEWRAIFALARYGGLRVPSELVGLTWADIDREHGRIRVKSPKTAHHGKGERIVPLFPELVGPLQELYDAAPEGSIYVVPMARDRNTNLRNTLMKIISAAGLVVWPKVFQNCRSSRETELVEAYPLHTVCAWLGNTAAIASKHYLQVKDADFKRATEAAAGDCAQKCAQSAPASDDIGEEGAITDPGKQAESAQCALVHAGPGVESCAEPNRADGRREELPHYCSSRQIAWRLITWSGDNSALGDHLDAKR